MSKVLICWAWKFNSVKDSAVRLALAMSSQPSFRVLMPNEGYYKYYDDPKYKDIPFIDGDAAEWDDDEDDDSEE